MIVLVALLGWHPFQDSLSAQAFSSEDSSRISRPDVHPHTILPEDSSRDSSMIVPCDSSLSPKIIYKSLLRPDSMLLNFGYDLETRISIDGPGIAHGPDDLLRNRAGIFVARAGPYGQPVFLALGGVPLRQFRVGDFICEYSSFTLPFHGLADFRLVPYADAGLVYVNNFWAGRQLPGSSLYPPAYPDSGAYTSAQMHKGDYGFSNTMVKFGAVAGQRARFGLAAGFRKSNGYLTETRKDLESYRFHMAYQLRENLQIQPDLLFFNTDDRVRFSPPYNSYAGRSRFGFTGLSLALAGALDPLPFSRMALIYQDNTQAVRGDHPKFRQQTEWLRMSLQGHTRMFGIEHNYIIEPYHKAVTFDPGYHHYAGLQFNSAGNYQICDRLKLGYCTGADWNKYANADISLTLLADYNLSRLLSLCAQAFRLSAQPSDAELFAKSPPLEISLSGGEVLYYALAGDDNLNALLQTGYVLSMKSSLLGINSELFFRQARFGNYAIWQDSLAAVDSVRACPRLVDADWITGGLELKAGLPLAIGWRAAYSYSRLTRTDDERNLALSPRHKLSVAVDRNIYIERLDLHTYWCWEIEYHSRNYASIYNPTDLGDYLAANLKIHVRVKTLTFFYNLENVFNKHFRNFSGYELGRMVWWGFRWNFFN